MWGDGSVVFPYTISQTTGSEGRPSRVGGARTFDEAAGDQATVWVLFRRIFGPPVTSYCNLSNVPERLRISGVQSTWGETSVAVDSDAGATQHRVR